MVGGGGGGGIKKHLPHLKLKCAEWYQNIKMNKISFLHFQFLFINTGAAVEMPLPLEDRNPLSHWINISVSRWIRDRTF